MVVSLPSRRGRRETIISFGPSILPFPQLMPARDGLFIPLSIKPIHHRREFAALLIADGKHI